MREWKYETKTEDAIRSALLGLLAKKGLSDVTVSELSREAGVSRSTFYEHFGNPADVYDSIVARFAQGLSPLMGQIACSSQMKPSAEPFCVRLRRNGPFAAAIDDDRFLGAFLGQMENLERHDLYGLLVEAGYTPEQSRALCLFQMAGCFTAARSAQDAGQEWADIKAVIDRFILGGIAACLSSKRE